MMKVGDYVRITVGQGHKNKKGRIAYMTRAGNYAVDVYEGTIRLGSYTYLPCEVEPWETPEPAHAKPQMTVELALELCDIEAALELVNDHKGYAFDQNDKLKSEVYSLTYVTLKTRYDEIMEMFK